MGNRLPLACAGIITKVNQVFFSIVIGLSQGMTADTQVSIMARKNYAQRAAGVWVGAQVGICGVGGVLLRVSS